MIPKCVAGIPIVFRGVRGDPRVVTMTFPFSYGGAYHRRMAVSKKSVQANPPVAPTRCCRNAHGGSGMVVQECCHSPGHCCRGGVDNGGSQACIDDKRAERDQITAAAWSRVLVLL